MAFTVQSSTIRAFGDGEYRDAGAEVAADLDNCPVIFAVKEIPVDVLEKNKTYIYFAHVVKGQAGNMEMLQRLIDLDCTLIDYERITDEQSRRLIFFGFHAGLAGMIETLWALGQRLKVDGFNTPLAKVKHAYEYPDLANVREKLIHIGEEIERDGLPKEITPLVFGVTGYGNVSRGAQDVLTALPVKVIEPEELAGLADRKDLDHSRTMYKVVFREEHTVKPKDLKGKFDLQEYFTQPEKYVSNFDQYLPHITSLVNCIYWTPKNPRLMTLDWVKEAWAEGNKPKMSVIGDISCDIGGAVECTTYATNPGAPVYTYIAETGESKEGLEGHGPVLMTVDNLPCELPRESSTSFGEALMPFVAAIAKAGYWAELEELALPTEIKKAVIVYNGELTKEYKYLEEYLKQEK